MKMPFGKYQDRELTDVPRPYLRWLRRQQWLGLWLAKEIDDVLNSKIVAPSNESFEELLKAWQEDDNLASKRSEKTPNKTIHKETT